MQNDRRPVEPEVETPDGSAASPPTVENSEVYGLVNTALRGQYRDYWPIAAKAGDCLTEVEGRLGREKRADRLAKLLYVYKDLAFLQGIETTPAQLLEIARDGPIEARCVAIDILGQIGDPAAVDLLGEILAREPMVAGESNDYETTILLSAISASGDTNSEILASQLAEIVRRGGPLRLEVPAVEAIGNIGFGDERELLQELEENSPRGDLMFAARRALTKVMQLQAPDREEKLMSLIEGMGMEGHFSWYEWALTKVVHLRLTGHAGRLREIYDKGKGVWVEGSPTSFSINVLAAIHKLGGSLSPEEIALLERAGRIR
ncbi:MAG: hypothetical protein HY720_31160 [Planctomycetes bacterium]|nr:hypothetical protein [Planctomycetota bacterium]